jgi:hypothetical protein
MNNTVAQFLSATDIVVVVPIFIYLIITRFRRTHRLGRRYRIDNLSRLAHDKRAPILYLRSFYDDYSDNPFTNSERTSEELITLALEDAGPIVAVGMPGEELPLLGSAARIYLPDDDWQDSVKYLMTIAQLVVIHADLSEGLLWEVKAARELVPPQRFMISLLAFHETDEETGKGLYKKFRERANPALGNCLPPTLGATCFLFFGPDWQPTAVKIGILRWLFLGKLTTGAVREALRIHLRRRGLRVGVRRTTIYAINVLLALQYAILSYLLVSAALSRDIRFIIAPFFLLVPYVLLVVLPTNLVIRLLLNVLHYWRQGKWQAASA